VRGIRSPCRRTPIERDCLKRALHPSTLGLENFDDSAVLQLPSCQASKTGTAASASCCKGTAKISADECVIHI
jgi:hypothetical protein